MSFVLSAVFGLLGFAFTAHAVPLEGMFEQGGFLWGHATPGSTVKLDKTALEVDAKGRFFAGLDRSTPAAVTLHVVAPDGQTTEQVIPVQQRKFPTQQITGVANKYVNPDPQLLKRIHKESAAIAAAKKPFWSGINYTRGFSLPVSAPKSGVYGSRRLFNGEERSWHKGLDLAAPAGTPVHAPAAGIVRLALPNSFFNGNLVVLDHGHHVFTIYAHLHEMAVKPGQHVAAGDVLGTVGATGRATGPHLHWGVYWRNMALDPALFVAAGTHITSLAEGATTQ